MRGAPPGPEISLIPEAANRDHRIGPRRFGAFCPPTAALTMIWVGFSRAIREKTRETPKKAKEKSLKALRL